MVLKQKDSRLTVIITDADTEMPIEGIPVSFYQKDNPLWQYIAIKTNKKGEATATPLKPSDQGGMVFYSVNFGGYFGYPQLKPDPFCAGIFQNMTTIRRHSLQKTIILSVIPKTE